MSVVNYGKVLVGGLAAGLIFNVIDVAAGYTFLQSDMKMMVDRLHLDPTVLIDPVKMIPWIGIDLMMGVVVVWTYAAMRPRFGPGPATAMKAGVVLWFAISLVIFGFVSMGVFTIEMFLKQSAEALVSTLIGSAVGGMIYTES